MLHLGITANISLNLQGSIILFNKEKMTKSCGYKTTSEEFMLLCPCDSCAVHCGGFKPGHALALSIHLKGRYRCSTRAGPSEKPTEAVASGIRLARSIPFGPLPCLHWSYFSYLPNWKWKRGTKWKCRGEISSELECWQSRRWYIPR